MQIELDHIGSGEAGSGQGREKEFIDPSIAGHPDRTGGSLMRGHNQTSAMPLCRDRHLATIKQIPASATFRMRELLVSGQGKALLDLSPTSCATRCNSSVMGLESIFHASPVFIQTRPHAAT